MVNMVKVLIEQSIEYKEFQGSGFQALTSYRNFK